MLAGEYLIGIGASVSDIRISEKVRMQGETYFRNEEEMFPSYFKPQPHGMDIPCEEFEGLYGRALGNDRNRKRGDYTSTCSFGDVSRKSLFGNIVRGVVGIGLKIMFPGKNGSDASFMMVKMGVEEGNMEGLIASSGGVVTPKLVDMLVYNANRQYGKAFARLFKK